jgi:hypothetical protein
MCSCHGTSSGIRVPVHALRKVRRACTTYARYGRSYIRSKLAWYVRIDPERRSAVRRARGDIYAGSARACRGLRRTQACIDTNAMRQSAHVRGAVHVQEPRAVSYRMRTKNAPPFSSSNSEQKHLEKNSVPMVDEFFLTCPTEDKRNRNRSVVILATSRLEDGQPQCPASSHSGLWS